MDDRLPLHVRVKDDLTQRIGAGEWGAGVALPPEGEMAKQYNVSLGTMRRVMGELSDEGVLDRRQGSGTFLRGVQDEGALHRFFRVGDGSTLPTGRITSVKLDQASAPVAKGLGIEVGADVLHLERVREIDGEAQLFERIWLPMPMFQPFQDADLAEIGDLLYPAFQEIVGVVVGSVAETLTVVPGSPEVCKILGCPTTEPLVRVERRAHTHGGATVEYREYFGPAFSFSYRVEVK